MATLSVCSKLPADAPTLAHADRQPASEIRCGIVNGRPCWRRRAQLPSEPMTESSAKKLATPA
jgi:hypothetical protein